MTDRRTILITCGVGGVTFVAGIFTGFLIAKKTLVDGYEAILEAEIEDVREQFAKKAKVRMYETPQEAARDLGLHLEAEQRGEPIFEELVEELTREEHEGIDENIFDGVEEVDEEELIKEKAARASDLPYIVTAEEFFQNEDGYQQHTLTYFEQDKVLVDDQDQPIENLEMYVGKGNLKFGVWSGDPNLVYIRNEKLDADYEITRSRGAYTVEVLGLDPQPVVKKRVRAQGK